MASYKNSSGQHLGAGWAVPTLIDCWNVRDLQRFRAILKGGPGAAVQLSTSSRGDHGATPGPKSPTSYGGSFGGHAASPGPAPPAEVNRRDLAGKAVLHHIASSEEGISIDFLLAILAHPSCNVNIQDTESGWTPLHRALYHGNLNHALTLLRHSHIDLRVKDLEGLTPFDLYNSTVAGTNPAPLGSAEAFSTDVRGGDLLLWGSNRNYTLGLGDGNDRTLPDLVTLMRQDSTNTLPPGHRFDRIKVKQVQMSRMHTVVLTQDKAPGHGNVWVAGIGSNGRLGRASSTQPTLQPLQDFKDHAAKIAVGPDHTLIVTTSGVVYSFGSNRFGTLGYAIEEGQGQIASSTGTPSGAGGAAAATFGLAGSSPQPFTDKGNKVYDVQITPRRVVGPLKKEVVLGAAVSKLHSVVFTHDALYTWGSNTGQLGYDKAATPIQVNPRKVTSLTASQSIRQVACTDHATALLLNTFDVLLLHGDVSFKLSFPMTRFNEKMSAGVFRPPQAQPKPSIAKLTSSGQTFAALSDYGDLFTFTLDHPSEYAKSGASGSKRMPAPEPQLVWSVRKKFTAVRDVAIGMDGSIILCTSSGHVFVRSRRAAGEIKQSSKSGAARAFKFAQIPLLQRVVRVATNESGSFAAIRSQAPIKEIRTKGRSLEDDLRDLLPHLQVWTSDGADGSSAVHHQQGRRITAGIGDDLTVSIDDKTADLPEARRHSSDSEDEDEDDDGGISESADDTAERHAQQALLVIEAAKRFDRGGPNESGNSRATLADVTLPFGCDLILIAGGKHLLAHRCIVGARIQRLSKLMESPPTKGAANAPEGVVVKKVNDKVTTLTLPSCSFHTGLFLLHYLYTDDLPAIWTASIGLRVERQLATAKVNRNTVQSQLRELASILALPALTPVFNSPVPRSPTPTLRADMLAFFKQFVAASDLGENGSFSPMHDVQLQLSDRLVPAHSVILRRSPFFSALLLPDWSATRWDEGKLRIDLSHLRWEVLSIFLRHIYTDESAELFSGLDADIKADDWIDLLTETLAGGNEFLLDRFKLVAASLLRNRIAPQNIAAMLTIADMYYSIPLKDAGLLYCAQNLESLLEGGMLDELEHKMVRELSAFIKNKQDEKMHRTRESDHIAALIVKHQEYYESLDIPPPSLNLASHRVGKRPPRSPNAILPVDAKGKQKGSSAGASTPAGRRSVNRSGGGSASPSASPALRATMQNDSGGMFDMDDEDIGSPSPSLGGMAEMSLNDARQPPSLGLPPAVSSAPWATAGGGNRHRPTSARGATPGSVPQDEGGSSPGGPATDLRSIMAAELARSRGPLTNASSPAFPGTPRRLPSGATPLSSVPNSGSATPIRGQAAAAAVTPSTRRTSQPLQNQPSWQGGEYDPSMAPPASSTAVLSPAAATKMSQRDRKKQQALAQAQAQAQASSQQTSSPPGPSTPQASPWKQVSGTGVAPSGSKANDGAPGWPSAGASATPLRPPLRQGFTTQKDNVHRGSVESEWPNANSGTPTKGASFSRPGLSGRSASQAVWSSSGAAGPSPVASTGSSGVGASRPMPTTMRASSSSSSSAPSPILRPTQGAGGMPSVALATTPSSSSFAQIQAQQAAAAAAASATPVKKSFMEIQAEETQKAEEREREEKERLEFESWFEEESRRVREQERESGGGKKGANKGKNKKKGGGGGGGGEEGSAEGSRAANGGGQKRGPGSSKPGNAKGKPTTTSTNGKGAPSGGAGQQQQQPREQGSSAKFAGVPTGPSNRQRGPQPNGPSSVPSQARQPDSNSAPGHLSATAAVFSPGRTS